VPSSPAPKLPRLEGELHISYGRVRGGFLFWTESEPHIIAQGPRRDIAALRLINGFLTAYYGGADAVPAVTVTSMDWSF